MNKEFIILSTMISLSGCIAFSGKNWEITTAPVNKAVEQLNFSLSSVHLNSNQIEINGSGLDQATVIKLVDTNTSTETQFQVTSKTATQIIATPLANLGAIASHAFNLIIGTAEAQSSYTVTFSLDDNSIDPIKLSDTGASSGQVLKFNGTSWVPSSLMEATTYVGTWDASTTIPDVGTSNPGDYYIVSVAHGTYAVGDWIISDGYNWSKVPYSKTSVASFQGRKGIVTLQPSDYVSLKDGTTNKVTGSSLNDIADIDLSTAPTNGQVLKWDTTTSKWKPSNDNSAASGIALTDLSASSPLSYNSTTGSFSLPTANVTALPLTGLSSGSGAIAATDSILSAFGKLMSLPSDYISRSSGASVTTGTIAVSGTGMITVPTATGTTATEVANVTYVSNSIAANGVWSKGASSSINYIAGNVGIGTTSPATILDIAFSNSSAAVPGFQLTNSNSAGKAQLVTVNSTGASAGVGIFGNTSSADSGSLANLGTVFSSTSLIVMSDGGTATGGSDPITFRVGGYNSSNERMRITSAGNVGIGTTSPQAKLDVDGGIYISGLNAIRYPISDSTIGGSIAIGAGALTKQDTLASGAFSNTAIGYNTLNSSSLTTAAVENTAVGNSALKSNTIGYANVAIGSRAAYSVTAGNQNVAIGRNSLTSNSIGSKNVAIGYNSLQYASGTENIGVGTTSVGGIWTGAASTGGFNTGIGGSSLARVTLGTGNTAIGPYAGYDVSSGSYNIFIGYFPTTGVGITTGNNNINIGYDIRPPSQSASNQLNIGNLIYATGLGSATTLSSGNVGIGTTAPDEKLVVDNGSTIGKYTATGWTHSSDRRMKHAISPLENSLEKILKLQGVNYIFNHDEEEKKQVGFIAQDVEKVYPEVVLTDEHGFKSMVYANLVAPIVEAMRELYAKWIGVDARVKKLEVENEILKSKIEKSAKENREMKARLEKIEKRLNSK